MKAAILDCCRANVILEEIMELKGVGTVLGS